MEADMEPENPSRYERRKKRMRDQIKAATASLVVEKGYEALTIQDITDRIDVARATFYLYFRDKDDVIWAILEESIQELNQSLRSEMTSAYQEWHFRKLVRVFEYAGQHRALLSIMLGDGGHIGLFRKLANYLARFIQEDIDSGLTPASSAAPTAVTAQFLAGATLQVLTWWLESPGQLSAQQIAEQFYALESSMH